MQRIIRAIIILTGLMISSCAYVQTHKNVEELGSYFEGELLDANSMSLHKKGDQWYLSAHKAKFKLSYPIVHDSVFRRNDFSPEFKLIRSHNSEVIYHPISSYAAQILQKTDGYFQLRGLADEIHRTSGKWVSDISGSQQYPIVAEIGGKQVFYIEERRIPEKKLFLSKALGKIDLIAIDMPATIIYNVAIPIMAPFVFFYEFSTTD